MFIGGVTEEPEKLTKGERKMEESCEEKEEEEEENVMRWFRAVRKAFGDERARRVAERMMEMVGRRETS